MKVGEGQEETTYPADFVSSQIDEREPSLSQNLDNVDCGNISDWTCELWIDEHVRPFILTVADCWHKHDDRAKSASLACSLRLSSVRRNCEGIAMLVVRK